MGRNRAAATPDDSARPIILDYATPIFRLPVRTVARIVEVMSIEGVEVTKASGSNVCSDTIVMIEHSTTQLSEHVGYNYQSTEAYATERTFFACS